MWFSIYWLLSVSYVSCINLFWLVVTFEPSLAGVAGSVSSAVRRHLSFAAHRLQCLPGRTLTSAISSLRSLAYKAPQKFSRERSMLESISGAIYYQHLSHWRFILIERLKHPQCSLVPSMQIFHSDPVWVLRATERRGWEFTRGHFCLKWQRRQLFQQLLRRDALERNSFRASIYQGGSQ